MEEILFRMPASRTLEDEHQDVDHLAAAARLLELKGPECLRQRDEGSAVA